MKKSVQNHSITTPACIPKHQPIAISEATDNLGMWKESPTYGLFSKSGLAVSTFNCTCSSWGSRDSSVVGAPDLRSKGHRFTSCLEWQENDLLHGQLYVLLFWYLSCPHDTTTALKRSQSFCQKCRLQLSMSATAPYVSGLFAWSEVTWCMVVWCTQNVPRLQQFHVAPVM